MGYITYISLYIGMKMKELFILAEIFTLFNMTLTT